MKTHLLLALLLLGCQSTADLNIAPGQVVETLTAYGKANPETRAILHTRKGDIETLLVQASGLEPLPTHGSSPEV